MHISRLFPLVSRRFGAAPLFTLHSSLFTIAAATAALALAAASARAQSAAINPYTYIGRVMDATHAAFGTNRVATLSAYDASGKLLATSKTFFLADSRCNYRLVIPLADADVSGYSRPGAVLAISVDDGAKVWAGVVVDPGRASGTVVGEPGGVREIDIVLGKDANGDGIDDDLYNRLKDDWEDSDYWRPGETFDPHRDYDGDGVPTIAEALSGTNPFDSSDSLKINSFTYAGGTRSRAAGAAPVSLTFNAIGGHAYTVEEATSLSAKDWKPREFFLSDSGTAVNVLSVPSGSGRSASTVYLLPSVSSNAFFRVRAE